MLHFAPDNDDNTIRHELEHCLGLWHELNRSDRDYWLDESPDADSPLDWGSREVLGVNAHERGAAQMPELGAYDYDSIMHYGSWGSGCVNRWTDRLGNTCAMIVLERGLNNKHSGTHPSSTHCDNITIPFLGIART